MVALSSPICSAAGASTQALTTAERANRAAIRACLDAAIADGALRRETDSAGLATLVEGFMVGLSIEARDGVSSKDLDAGVIQAMSARDATSPRV